MYERYVSLHIIWPPSSSLLAHASVIGDLTLVSYGCNFMFTALLLQKSSCNGGRKTFAFKLEYTCLHKMNMLVVESKKTKSQFVLNVRLIPSRGKRSRHRVLASVRASQKVATFCASALLNFGTDSKRSKGLSSRTPAHMRPKGKERIFAHMSCMVMMTHEMVDFRIEGGGRLAPWAKKAAAAADDAADEAADGAADEAADGAAEAWNSL